MRIAVVMNMIAPHATPVFAALAQQPDVDLLVVYEAAMEGNRAWTPERDLPFEHVVLRSLQVDLTRVVSDAYVNLPLRPLQPLSAFAPDAVIGAGAGVWASPATIAALAARARRGWALVPWWVSFPRERPSLPRRIAEPWVRRFVAGGDSWIVYGERSRREALRLGAAAARIVTAPPVPPLRAPAGATVRSTEERSAGVRFLVVAQLIPRKGIDVAIEAFRALEGPHELWIAGTGPLAGAIEEAATSDPRITLLGHLDWDALDRAYREADVAVLPSRYEVWGQVVSEGQAHGMPVVATAAVGAAADLIHEGSTGFVVPPGDAPALTAAMRTLVGWAPEQWDACGGAARSTFEAWTVDDAAAAFAHACRLGAEHRHGVLAAT